jgi:hypothetical protein
MGEPYHQDCHSDQHFASRMYERIDLTLLVMGSPNLAFAQTYKQRA